MRKIHLKLKNGKYIRTTPYYKTICLNCNKEFLTDKHKFCSVSCASSFRYKVNRINDINKNISKIKWFKILQIMALENFKSLNEFSKTINIKQPILSTQFKRFFGIYNIIKNGKPTTSEMIRKLIHIIKKNEPAFYYLTKIHNPEVWPLQKLISYSQKINFNESFKNYNRKSLISIVKKYFTEYGEKRLEDINK